MLVFHLPKSLQARLERLSERSGKSTSDYLIEALTEYIDDLEDHHLSNERLEQFGSSPGVPLEVMMKKYGLGK